MPLQHYLPASFIANFSTNLTMPRRDRVVAAADKTTGKVFATRASKVGGVNDLYTLTSAEMDPLMVDRSLSGYESNLSMVLDELMQRNVSAMAWATTLVPFVSGLMVRGPDFATRFDLRIAQLGVEPPPGNTNMARLMEFQRLLAPVAAAQWIVLTVGSDDPLITSDIGHSPFANPAVGHFGMAVPIDLRHILLLVPRPRSALAVARGGEWQPMIAYVGSPGVDHVGLNEMLALRATRFIFGPDTSTVAQYVREQRGTPPPLEPGQMGFVDGYFAMLHDLDWHRLISALATPPREDGQFIYIDLLRDRR